MSATIEAPVGVLPNPEDLQLVTSLSDNPDFMARADELVFEIYEFLLDQDSNLPLQLEDLEPEEIKRRIRRLEVDRFEVPQQPVTIEANDPASQLAITAYPISHFKDQLGVNYKDSTTQQKASYTKKAKTLETFALTMAGIRQAASQFNPDDKKASSALRRQIVENFNDQAGSWFDGQKQVINGKHLSGFGSELIASRSASYWLGGFAANLDQAQHPDINSVAYDTNHKGVNIRIGDKSTKQADMLIAKLLETKPQLFSDINGYLAISLLLFGGDMQKAFTNISAVAKLTGQTMPEGLQAFGGSTTEFRQVEQLLRDGKINGSAEGYLAASDDYFGGDMQKAFANISAVAKLTGQAVPEGLQAFQGSTTEFRQVEQLLRDGKINGSAEGYLAASDDYFGGNMKKAFINISAVAKLTGQAVPEGLQAFGGSTAEFRQVEQLLRDGKINGSAEGYLAASDDYFGGDMKKAFINISAVAKLTGQTMPEGLQAFQGSTTEFKRQRQFIIDNPDLSQDQLMIKFKLEFYKEVKSKKKPTVNFKAVYNLHYGILSQKDANR